MHWIAFSIIYLGFFAVIGYAVYLTESAWPLFALLLTPTLKHGKDKTEDEENG